MQGAPGAHGSRGRRSTPVTLPAAAGAGGTIGGPSASGAADGRRPATPGVQEQADVGGDVVAQESDLQQDDCGEDQHREQPRPIRRPAVRIPPLVERLPRLTPSTRDGGPPIDSLLLADPELSTTAFTSAASSARTTARSIAAQAVSSICATSETPATGSSVIARSSSAKSWSLAGSARRARPAPARSASRASTAVTVDTTVDDDLPLRSPCDAGPSMTRPSVSITI